MSMSHNVNAQFSLVDNMYVQKKCVLTCIYSKTLRVKTTTNQAQSEYKRSLTFRVRVVLL